MTLFDRSPLLQGPSFPPIPPASWTRAHLSPTPTDPARRLPQAIAHRGFKARYPENTMAAFSAAIDAGAHALETDIHLSSDGVVVLSHDPSLKRCYGVDRPVRSCPWSFLSGLRTVRPPHEPLPRLVDLLELLARPEHSDIWVLLDIKVNDPTDVLLAAAKDAVESVKRPDGLSWDTRIVMGCWNQHSVHTVLDLFPTYSAANIAWSPRLASRFLRDPAYPGLSFNMMQPALVGPWGSRWIRQVRAVPDADSRYLFAWTVNDPEWMDWSIRKGFDGVVTDDPALFLQVRKRFEEEAFASQRDADGKSASTSTSTSTSTDATRLGESDGTSSSPSPGWKRWAKLYFRVATLQVLITFLMPILSRSKRFTFTKSEQRPVHKR